MLTIVRSRRSKRSNGVGLLFCPWRTLNALGEHGSATPLLHPVVLCYQNVSSSRPSREQVNSGSVFFVRLAAELPTPQLSNPTCSPFQHPQR